METPSPIRPPEYSVSRGIKRILFWFFALLIILVLLTMTTGPTGPSPVEAAFVLATGWIQFLARTVPRVSWNWDLVGMGVGCSAVIVFLAQRFLDWLARRIASERGASWRWPWKWTVSGLIAVGLCFLVGMCVAGMAHQIGWLGSQSGSWYERKGAALLDLRLLDGVLQQALLDAGDDVAELRRKVRKLEFGQFRGPPAGAPLRERFHVLLIMEGTNKIKGLIIFPRDQSGHGRSRGTYWFGDRKDYLGMEELSELIEKHQKQLLAL